MPMMRVLNLLAGTWLLVSAFLWPHARGHLYNTWAVAILALLAGLAAVAGSQGARKVGFALGLWLSVSTLLLPNGSFPVVVNNILMAVALVVTSLFPDHVEVHRVRGDAPHGQGPFGPEPATAR